MGCLSKAARPRTACCLREDIRKTVPAIRIASRVFSDTLIPYAYCREMRSSGSVLSR